jgi:phosphoribosyl-AMP cyclohydrolase / phosphoribosyl-ATP pyrophosphohydrolase
MINWNELNTEKVNGMVPVIVQDANTLQVLMMGYMNQEALEKTLAIGKVTFFSRTKNRLWTKGEESGNFLELVDLKMDCDKDTLLAAVNPIGPTCHKGTFTCWNETKATSFGFVSHLETTIAERKNNPTEESYVASLFAKGINKIAQKVGEEAVEVVIEAKDNNDELFLGESADLFFHYLILLQAKGFSFENVLETLKKRVK